jgi:hypothetical protein
MALTTVQSGMMDSIAQYNSFKNRIINGAMVIDQRNNGASITPTNGQYAVDRFIYYGNQTSKFTAQQNAGAVTPPTGFTKYLGVTSSSAYTVLTGDYFCLGQHIEGFNTADLAFGTASAATITLSFYARSSLTGTFGGVISNGGSRSYPFTYTISAANTWTAISVTIPGDTSGTWGSSNSYGITVYFGLGVGTTYSGTAGSWSGSSFFSATGATSVVGTSGATFYITGVQLEKGSTATSFDYRPYTTELQLCQRYLPAWNMTAVNQIFGQGQAIGTGTAVIHLPFKVSARVAPTGITASAAANFYLTVPTYSVAGTYSSTLFGYGSTEGIGLTCTTSTGLTAGNTTTLAAYTTSAQILATGCEL